MEAFPPTLQAAWARVEAVQPLRYGRTRNALDGAVTRLSPYITHGFVSLPEVHAKVSARHPLQAEDRFVMELGWREYFQHVWAHRGDAILQSLHQGPLPDDCYSREMPPDIREARTGVPVIDQAVRTLYASAYLHNHARMWLASYVVHLRKVHWRCGADWMIAHLLDGDLASNHLSWQWVAGTASHKPYLFNAENVARFAPAQWHSPDTVLDTSYEHLQTLAASLQSVPVRPRGAGLDEPAVFSRPPVQHAAAIDNTPFAALTDRDVWLVHPWSLAPPPADLPAGTLCVGWWPTEYHARWPWSAARWAFVGERMRQMSDVQWVGTREQLVVALSAARSVQTQDNPHLQGLIPDGVRVREPSRLFREVQQSCSSFSRWWKLCQKEGPLRTASRLR